MHSGKTSQQDGQLEKKKQWRLEALEALVAKVITLAELLTLTVEAPANIGWQLAHKWPLIFGTGGLHYHVRFLRSTSYHLKSFWYVTQSDTRHWELFWNVRQWPSSGRLFLLPGRMMQISAQPRANSAERPAQIIGVTVVSLCKVLA